MLAANSQRVHGWSLRWMHDGYDGPTSVVRLWRDCYMMVAQQERQRAVTGATFLSISSELIRRNTMLNQWLSEGRRHSCKVTRWHPMPTNFVPRHHRATVVSLWKGEIKVWSSFPVLNTTTSQEIITNMTSQKLWLHSNIMFDLDLPIVVLLRLAWDIVANLPNYENNFSWYNDIELYLYKRTDLLPIKHLKSLCALRLRPE